MIFLMNVLSKEMILHEFKRSTRIPDATWNLRPALGFED